MRIKALKNILMITAIAVASFVAHTSYAEDNVIIARFSSDSFKNTAPRKDRLLPKNTTKIFQHTAMSTATERSVAVPSKFKDRVRVADPAQRSLERELSQAPVKSNIPSFFLNFLMLKF